MNKNILAIIALASATSIAFAQGETSSNENTSVQTQLNATNTVRLLSLRDCVQIGLEHNLDVQVNRIAPQISRYSYQSSFSGYDPTLTASYTYGYSKNPSSITVGSTVTNFTKDIYSDSLNGGLSWTAPTGTRVNTTGSYRRSGLSSGMYNYNPSNEDQFTASGNISLSQPLLKGLWIDDTRMGIKVARKNLDISKTTYEYALMTTILSIEIAYYDLIGAKENVIVAEQNLAQAEEFLAETLKKVELGTLIELDSKDAESQVSAAKTSLISMKQTYKTAANTLRTLLSDDFTQWQDVDFNLTDELSSIPAMPSRAESWYKGMTERPDLKEARLNLEVNDIYVRYNYNQLFPQLDLVGSYGHSGAKLNNGEAALTQVGQGTYPYYTIGGELTVPLGNISARNAYKSRKAQREQTILQLKQKEQNVMVEIDNAINSVNSSYDAILSTRDASKYAEEAWQAGKIKLEQGKSTSFEVLELHTTLFQRKLSEITALVTYNKNLATLRYTEGATLENYNIVVTYE